jgi:hypothetical protein
MLSPSRSLTVLGFPFEFTQPKWCLVPSEQQGTLGARRQISASDRPDDSRRGHGKSQQARDPINGSLLFRACDVSALHKALAPERAFLPTTTKRLNHPKHAAARPDMLLQLLVSKNHQLIVYRADAFAGQSLIESDKFSGR